MAHKAAQWSCFKAPDPHLKSQDVVPSLSPWNILPGSICTLKLGNLADLGWAMSSLLMLRNRISLAAQRKAGGRGALAARPSTPTQLAPNASGSDANSLKQCHAVTFVSLIVHVSLIQEAVKRLGAGPPASVCSKYFYYFYRIKQLSVFKSI